MNDNKSRIVMDPWAKLRFSVIAGLLASPPEYGKLKDCFKLLASQTWKHPSREERLVFHWSTIERWYYRARNSNNPIDSLTRKMRRDHRQSRRMHPLIIEALHNQYTDHPSWSYQLHTDNLAAYIAEHPGLGEPPSYSTVCRHMKSRGWFRKKSLPRNPTEGQIIAYDRREKREIRSYESEFIHGLWHLDFHVCKRRVVDAQGNWHTPRAFCVMDDKSRVCCHLQWYLTESAQTLFHGLVQGFYKRGLPRSLMTDNGKAMLAGEIRNGLEQSGIVHELTLPYSPYQNGKQETFWSSLEGRLMKMLEDVEPLTLDLLNQSTQAWVELEYNRRFHREIKSSPIDRMVAGPSVNRDCPDSEKLRMSFCTQAKRTQRRSDGTITISGIRFEIPSRFRHLQHITIRYQSWDLSVVYMMDDRTGNLLAHLKAVDKTSNARGIRRTIEDTYQSENKDSTPKPIPPLLRKYISEYAATGLPPGYLPLNTDQEEQDNDNR
ncbi:MAG: DDE-type integrase/transposase/recombinase [Bacteroidales bacterium]|nr:DDE-type integrase/transposase/recombinase [Bacteroidales bacterium]